MSEDQPIDSDLEETIRAAGRETWRARFASYEQEQQSASPIRHLKTWIGIAAGLLMVFLISWGAGVFDKHTDKLYASYFSPHPSPPSLRGEGADPSWNNAIALYQQDRYQEAATIFHDLAEAEKYQPVYVAHFYAAAAAMAQKKPDIALIQAHLQSVLERDNDYRLPAKWYLCLSYLKEERYARLRLLLQQIVDEGDYKAEEAAQLLEDL